MSAPRRGGLAGRAARRRRGCRRARARRAAGCTRCAGSRPHSRVHPRCRRAILIAVFALAALGAAPAGAAARLVHFKSPSGNINCIGGDRRPSSSSASCGQPAWPHGPRAGPAAISTGIPYELSLGSRRVRHRRLPRRRRARAASTTARRCATGSSVNIGPIRCRSAAERRHLPLRERQARRLPHRARGLRHLAHVTADGDRRERALALVRELGPGFAERAAGYDRETAFPFENYAELRDAGHARALHPRALRRHGRELPGLHARLGRARRASAR